MPAILVLRLSSLGDVVLTSSFLQSAREHFPEAHLDFVVRDDLVPIATALPGLRRVVAVARRAGPAALAQLGSALARENYMHVFDLHSSLRTRLLTWRLRRRLRPGFSKQELPRWLLVHAHRDVYGSFGGVRPLRDRMLDPLRRLGHAPSLHDTHLVISQAARARALECLGNGTDRVRVAVAPGARWPSKRWPAQRFAALVARLAATPATQFVVLGENAEAPLAAAVARAAPQASLDLCGRLELLETAAVLQRCRLLITNDSGLMHVAEAVGCPVLAIFGPTTPAFGYAPFLPASRLLHRPPACNPCSKNGSRPCHRPTHECMENIGVEEVATLAQGCLAARPGVAVVSDRPI